MSIPEESPLRHIYQPFWHIRTNDEGPPRDNGFHPLVNAGKINVVAPARVTGYGSDGHTVLLDNEQTLEADLVILATGYNSSWDGLFDGQSIIFSQESVLRADFILEKTAADIGLHRHQSTTQPVDEWAYTSLANPPPTDPENTTWSSSLYRGIIPAKNINRRDFAINGAVVCVSQPILDIVSFFRS